MTTNTHIAAQARSLAESHDSIAEVLLAGSHTFVSRNRGHLAKNTADLLRQCAQALEAAELGEGKADARAAQLEWFALVAHWYINASDQELTEQGQERVDALKQVHLLSEQLEKAGFEFSTPPQAPALDAQGEAIPVANSRPLREYLKERIATMTPGQLAEFVEARERIQSSISAPPPPAVGKPLSEQETPSNFESMPLEAMKPEWRQMMVDANEKVRK